MSELDVLTQAPRFTSLSLFHKIVGEEVLAFITMTSPPPRPVQMTRDSWTLLFHRMFTCRGPSQDTCHPEQDAVGEGCIRHYSPELYYTRIHNTHFHSPQCTHLTLTTFNAHNSRKYRAITALHQHQPSHNSHSLTCHKKKEISSLQ